MAKPNYSFAKRQRELAKQQKKEEKLRRQQERKGQRDETATPEAEANPDSGPA